MDRARAIHIYRNVLQGIIATLFDMLGLEEGDTSLGLISRRLYGAVLRELQPAEAAVRRLIVIAARGLVVELNPAKPKATGASGQKGVGRRKGAIGRKPVSRHLAFPLFDQRKRFAALGLETGPCPSGVASHPSAAAHPPEAAASPASPPNGRVDARRLCLRLQAVTRALEDIPGQARRLARLRARRSKVLHLKLLSPLRPGPPPGHRKRQRHEIDQVLREIHGLAFDALRADTS